MSATTFAAPLLLAVSLAACAEERRYPRQCSDPPPHWRKPNDGYGVLAVTNRVTVTRDAIIRWNGKRISVEQLNDYAGRVPELDPLPFTILDPEDGAPCELVEEVRGITDARVKCAESQSCGEGPKPWARIGDVVGPKGETYKYFPDQE